jgi:hypothetical protein
MLREIVCPRSSQLTVEIPQEYVNKKVEILVLPFFEMKTSTSAGEEAHGYDEDLVKLFKNASNVKIDKNIDIDELMNEVNDVVL